MNGAPRFSRACKRYRVYRLAQSDDLRRRAIAAVGLKAPSILILAIAGPAASETGFYARHRAARLGLCGLSGPSRQPIVRPGRGDDDRCWRRCSRRFTRRRRRPTAPQWPRLPALAVGMFCLIARALRLGSHFRDLPVPRLITSDRLPRRHLAFDHVLARSGRLSGVKHRIGGADRPRSSRSSTRPIWIHWPSRSRSVRRCSSSSRRSGSASCSVPGPVIVVVLAVTLSASSSTLRGARDRGGRRRSDRPAAVHPAGPFWRSCRHHPLLGVQPRSSSPAWPGHRDGPQLRGSRRLRGRPEPGQLTGYTARPTSRPGSSARLPGRCASDSRSTAVNMTVGGRTQVARLAAAAALVATLAIFGPALRILPHPGARRHPRWRRRFSLIDAEALREIRRISGVEFLFVRAHRADGTAQPRRAAGDRHRGRCDPRLPPLTSRRIPA